MPRLFLVFAITVSIFTGMLLALPWVLGLGLQWWLRDNISGTVSLTDVDFNLFTGTASLDELSITDDNEATLALHNINLDVDWLPLIHRQLQVRSMTVDGLEVVIKLTTDGQLLPGVIKLPIDNEESSAEPWDYALDSVTIRNSRLIYDNTEISVNLGLTELSLAGLETWTKNNPVFAVRRD